MTTILRITMARWMDFHYYRMKKQELHDDCLVIRSNRPGFIFPGMQAVAAVIRSAATPGTLRRAIA